MSCKSNTRVAILRARLGITQSDLADRVGVSQQTIDRLERGVQNETGPQRRLLDQIETLLSSSSSCSPAPESSDAA